MVAVDANTEDNQTAPVDPLRQAYRRLQVWRGVAIVCLVVACSFLGVAMVLAWQGTRVAQQALQALPEYQVLALQRDYELAAAALEESYQTTQARLRDGPTRQALARARQLPEQLLTQEQAHQRDIEAYGQAVINAAADIPGSREWRRHFRGQLDQLVSASQARITALQARLTRYPPVPEAPSPAE